MDAYELLKWCEQAAMPLLIKQYDGDPAIICAIGMLAGFCGTLMTPMAANFNVVPANLLDQVGKEDLAQLIGYLLAGARK